MSTPNKVTNRKMKAPNARSIGARNVMPDIWEDPTLATSRHKSLRACCMHPFGSTAFSIILVSLMLEILATVVFTVVTNLAHGGGLGANTLINGAVVGIAAGGSFYISSTMYLEGSGMPRYASLTLLVATMILWRTSPLAGLGYIVAQFLGVLIGGAILFGIGAYPAAAFPNGAPAWETTINAQSYWLAETFGVFCIVLVYLASYMLGTTLEQEREEKRLRRANLYAAATRAVVTMGLYRFQGYVFEPMVYVAGILSTCFAGGACSTNGSAAFYMLLPLLPTLVAALIVVALVGIFSTADYKVTVTKEGTEGEPEKVVFEARQMRDNFITSSPQQVTKLDDLVTVRK